MTLGEKIKEARNRSGLSQEQLSESLSVSRSAVAKWETDKGIPDVDNLKALSKCLNVSVDHLLDDSGTIDELVIREPYDLSEYGKGLKKTRKDRVIQKMFPDAEIQTLIGKIKLTKGEKVVDNALGFLTDAPFGIPEFINSIKNLDKEFYLVNKNDKQFFVTVTDKFIETRRIADKIVGDKFDLGNWTFTKCPYKVKPQKP